MKVSCTYFKPSGKYYSEGTCEVDDAKVKELIYPSEIGRYLLKNHKLPGLIAGTWSGPIMVHPENMYPELVI